VVADIETAEGRGQVRQLVTGADVLIHDLTDAQAAAAGLSFDILQTKNPGLVVVAITPFGATGPLADWHGSDLVHLAMSGYLYMTGPADGRPIKPSAPVQSYLHAGNHAFTAALLALHRRRRTGEGAFIDQAIRDTGTWMLTHTYQHWDMQRINLKRQGASRDMGARKRLKSVYESADGHLIWMFATGHIGGRGMQALIAWMDGKGMAPAWLKAIDWFGTDLLNSEPDLTEKLEAVFSEFFATKRNEELLEWAIASGTMMAPANNIVGVAADPQLIARVAWRTIEQPGLGSITVPGPPVRIAGVGWEPRGPAPRIGEPGDRDRPAQPETAQVHGAPGALPLAGLRVLDFGSTLAAPIVGRHLADFGAEVIKIESLAHPDTLRVGTPYANEAGGLDRSGYFAAYNAGKQSFSLNLQAPGALDIVRRLVAVSDVLIENFAPGVMQRLGLGHKQLHAWNPRLVVASHSLQGQTGPRSRHRGYGQIASALTGWYDLTGEKGGELLGPYSAYTDFLSWPIFLSAVLVALAAREATGAGQYIDHAQVESSLHFLAPLLLEHQLTGRARTRSGNREEGLAPNNTYPCAGDDRWIAITVASDGEWAALCAVLGIADAATDPRFATLRSRKGNEGALDELLDERTLRFAPFDLARRLQAAGVPAGVVAKASDLFEDPQLAHRRFFRRLPHPVLGDHAVLTHSFRIAGMAPGPQFGAPLLGEHTYAIARDLLGMSEDEIGDLVGQGVLY
jgi:crotonobetainyl-CoA:carnitine CoA-transferase CaiB-like acyl-CoA transferase